MKTRQSVRFLPDEKGIDCLFDLSNTFLTAQSIDPEPAL